VHGMIWAIGTRVTIKVGYRAGGIGGTKVDGGDPFLSERVRGVPLFQLRRKKILLLRAFLSTFESQTTQKC
jgi:hypothetical protein